MKVYELYYPKCGVRQRKVLISHDVFMEYRSMADPKEAKAFLREHTRGMEFFTDKSPLFHALSTGLLTIAGHTFPVEATLTGGQQASLDDIGLL